MVEGLHVGSSLLPHDTSKLCPSLISNVDTLLLNYLVERQWHVNPPLFLQQIWCCSDCVKSNYHLPEPFVPGNPDPENPPPHFSYACLVNFWMGPCRGFIYGKNYM